MTIYWKDKKKSLCPSHLICSDREVGNICVEKPAETGGGHFVESIEINTKSCDVRELNINKASPRHTKMLLRAAMRKKKESNLI